MLAQENLVTTHSAFQCCCSVYIVGNNHFQNILLADEIETHSKWKCSVIDNIASICSIHEAKDPNPTVVLTDCFVLSDANLTETLQAEVEQLPPDWALALFNLNRQTNIEKKTLQCGIRGYFYQDDSVDTFLKGLAAVFSGEIWVSRQMMADVIRDNSFEYKRNLLYSHTCTNDLTKREVEILAMLTQGATNKRISDKLCISSHTVRTHFNHIFRKIKVSSRLEASLWAAKTFLPQNRKN
ncbi:MAG TPA: response regulator transcription factor [Dongiaceae bacterium]|nr:response regulator transcription factor [Dongiaceae bacterium]